MGGLVYPVPDGQFYQNAPAFCKIAHRKGDPKGRKRSLALKIFTSSFLMLDDLYQDIILEHARSPCHYGPLEGATHRGEGYNPACGDTVSVALIVQDGRIAAVHFTGAGCSISQASASLMTQALQGLTLEQSARLTRSFCDGMVGAVPLESDALAPYGDLAALSGVRHFPLRIKCATLAWHALEAALHKQ